MTNVSKLPLNEATTGMKTWLAETHLQIQAMEQLVLSLEPGIVPGEIEKALALFRLMSAPLEEHSRISSETNPTNAPSPPGNDFGELVVLARQEREFLGRLLALMSPNLQWDVIGEQLRLLCQKPFELSGFYLAQANWASQEIHFPYFYEVGRIRQVHPIPLNRTSGLTGWAIFQKHASYLDTAEACQARGMILTASELRSGLHAKSWFGAPLPSPDPMRPMGLMGFHCFHPNAFSPERRRRMTLVARLTALHLQDQLDAP